MAGVATVRAARSAATAAALQPAATPAATDPRGGLTPADRLNVVVHTFPKRHYQHLSDVVHDLRSVERGRKRLRELGREATIGKAFQERLMLAVTEVNGCRYCAYAHARVALAAGVSSDEIATLAGGGFDGAPPEQVPALLYAQHWAEADAKPDAATRQSLLDTYGLEKAEAIEQALRMIRVGNLLGNAGDYALFRLSGGRWGKAAPRTSPRLP